MRLSEVRGERVFDVIADLVVPVSSIATSDALKGILERQSTPDGMTPREFMLQRVTENLPTLIRNHKDDIVEVLATIGGVTPDEYLGGMTFGTLYADVMELLTDDAFTDFLASATPVAEDGR